MTVLKCKMCGGDIQVEGETSYGTCDSCGSTMTLPKISNHHKANLFNRANHFRRQSELDKAIQAYENILNEDDTDAEAHWGVVLSRYGIEYVEDPVSHQRVPTCHRVQSRPILADPDYIAALEHAADEYSRSLYEEEAKRISEIQRGILAISDKEEPYDVFICYKETTDSGSRTKDSTIAQDIYYNLKNAGYKVFFSRITLEDKLGSEYEPYIYAALKSARVMIVVGTSLDNFNAVWVKNEWSRFLAMTKTDRNRLLIPCYRDMDPYDLPGELSMLQSQDMSKIGFIQDITRGIKKVLDSNRVKTAPKSVSDMAATDSLERWIQNSNTYLNLKNYPAAKEVFTRVTKEYPEDYRGWWGLMICDTTDFTKLIDAQSSLDTLFGYVRQLSSADELAPLESRYLEYINKVAHAQAEDEVLMVRKEIDCTNAEIATFEGEMIQVKQHIIGRGSEFDKQIAFRDETISDTKKRIAQNEKGLRKHRNKWIIGGVFSLVGLMLIFYSSTASIMDDILGLLFGYAGIYIIQSKKIDGMKRWIIGGILLIIGLNYINTDISSDSRFFGFVLSFIGFSIMKSKKKGKRKTWLKAIDDENEQLRTLIQARETDEKRYDEDLSKLNGRIKALNDKISKANMRIIDLKAYLEHGESEMMEMFYSLRCRSIGVEQEPNSITEELRQVAFG